MALDFLRKVSSTGRLAFIATMVLALGMWSPWFGGSIEIPTTMQTTLMAILTYVLGSKATSAWRAGRE